MKFRFCGDLDCPDWVLAEISILSKVSSVKMKLLCAQVIAELLGGLVNYEKVSKLTSDAKYTLADVKASIASLVFIFSSAAKYNVDGESLSNELQQLGLPKEHGSALAKVYEDKLQSLQDCLRLQTLRTSSLQSIDWRVDYVIGSSKLNEVEEPEIQIKLNKRHDCDVRQLTEAISFTVDGDKFRVLLAELKTASQTLKDVS